MNEETKQNSRAKASYGDAFSMTPEEKTISFLNRYFVYKKIRNVVDVDAISMKLKHKTGAEAENEIQNISEPKRFSQNLGPISTAYKGTAADAAATALKEQKPVKRIIKRKVADPKAAQQGPPAAAAAATAAPAPAATAVVERAPVVKRKGKNIEL